MEALRLARHKQFGTSSEKSEDTLMEQLSFLFNEAEVFAEVSTKQEEAVVVAAHKRHKKHEYTLDNIPEGIPTKQVEHRLEGEELVCPQCGDTMTEIGKEVVRTLEIIPAQTIVREDVYYTYACKSCSENADEGCRNTHGQSTKGKEHHPRQFRHTGSCRPYHDPKVRHGQPSVPSGAGPEPPGHSPEPPDYVQLDPESHRELSGACV